MKTAVALAVFILVAAAYVAAHADPVNYRILYSPGGNLAQFRETAAELRKAKTPIIVDGPCYSACTVLVDEDRAQVCITERAVFGYHQGTVVGWLSAQHGQTEDRTQVPYSPDVAAWIEAHGGLPTADVLMMRYPDASGFYRAC